ncbi:MAG: hypothetical protein KC776_19790 [Myxococcales bacterium]|nr:hypothetical protein [Myxococcales bacterium]MCB9581345.1 hypothetical protein [Polyangiaceae bacterium]
MRRFKKLWPRVRTALESSHPTAAQRWDEVMTHGRGNPSARSGDCGELRHTVEDTLSETEYSTSLLYGDIANLAAGTTCWQVSFSEAFDTLIACFDMDEGQLLLIWAPPEG